ncbi:MAG: pyrroline-5-carboxylate reductase [Desulfosalsimonadaceae bacterium]
MNTKNKKKKLSIGFIGAGNMAEAMIAALIRTGAFPPDHILAGDVNPQRSEYMEKTYGIKRVDHNRDIVAACRIVVFAVKPQQMADLLKDLSASGAFDAIMDRLLVISIAAGVHLETFEKALYAGKTETERQRIPIVRVMPNTPALVGAGMCAFSTNCHATGDDIDITRRILGAMGEVIHCDESKMDAVTAVSGSGPAYCFYFIESIIEAGEKLGLTPEEAFQLTVSTVKGALRLMEVQGESPAALRRKVTSPGGTTEAALRVFEENRLREKLIAAVASAARRAQELGQS